MAYVDKIVVEGTTYDLGALESLKDVNGRNRFIEGEITPETVSGITFTYARWSLSGTHLMIVLAGTMAGNTSLSHNQTLAWIDLPSWIINKIYPTTASVVSWSELTTYPTTDPNNRESSYIRLGIDGNRLNIHKSANSTYVNGGGFRIQFDLLIDTD